MPSYSTLPVSDCASSCSSSWRWEEQGGIMMELITQTRSFPDGFLPPTARTFAEGSTFPPTGCGVPAHAERNFGGGVMFVSHPWQPTCATPEPP